MSGAEMIAAERQRQKDEEGWTPFHDAHAHPTGELTGAAIAYAAHAKYRRGRDELPNDWWPKDWDFKPSDDPVRNLVKAGALIAAEIDRLQNPGGSNAG